MHIQNTTIEQFIQALFSHIQTYSEPYVTFAYAEIWHIWNPGIFRNIASRK